MNSLVNKNILNVKPYKPGKPIEEVRRQLGIKGPVFKMASNENSIPPSKKVMSAVKDNLKKLNRYPDGGCFYLKNELARKYRLKPENIIIGNGSDELIVMALRAFASEGDEVIIAKPTFLIYEIASEVEGLNIVRVPVRNFRHDLDEIARKISKKTKIIFIANPDNPTGTYVTKSKFELFLKKIGKNTIVFVDEAYYEFAKSLRDYPDAVKYLKEKNLIITRTFSKIYSLAGLRVGYGFAKPYLIEAMNKVREPFNVNSLAQVAAVAALKDNDFMRKSLKLVREGKKYLYTSLSRLGYDYIESATNFVLIKIGNDSNKIYEGLLRKGIIVREMSQWALKGFIRVTVGTTKENRAFIKALKELT